MSDSPRTQYRTSPPAKLNLFLEILGRRDDGFHELDTVMVAIDWRDELQLEMTATPGISLAVQWLPSRSEVASDLGVEPDDPLLDVPTDGSNLVHRALELINDAAGYSGGWLVRLGKRIPSGAGMGGASSDAAATLRLAAAALASEDDGCLATLTGDRLVELAEQLGSDVPFFLGDVQSVEPTVANDLLRGNPGTLARALGRGERLTFYDLPHPHRFGVVYPAIALSTAQVYRHASVTEQPRSGLDAVNAFLRPHDNTDTEILYNALTRPACGLSPPIGEAIQCLRELGQPNASLGRHRSHCQMTGSGSACFIWLTPDGESIQEQRQSNDVNEAWLATIRERLPGGALVQTVATCPAAPEIHIA
ncbi:4-(cytidine 5'-diphospho)-2-C-methyl-D-erythritol kinase [Allorhodopirellula solitaria]|uniref:4-diphosphocytidyl-2-C-methyl-D-erythritol kinase n=1 Tax=Allorhodopirellula solitaria TaxID=2527987 RepID=A0A5C5YJD8_9BACT|nr:4-(cytidine 5'-diphospho)-2-C-methyl-D-erythritol kinase [Allorhodopirellula solitaria]TWT74994.1 4-diphosphocytidyl-2-C-methyl-D-erythritol kinase [Allorhodopirellula solitaria]